MGRFKKTKHAASHLNIVPIKAAIMEEWNKISEEYILKASESFQGRVDIIIEKKMVAILSKFTVLCLSSNFVVYFLKININLVLSSCCILSYKNIPNSASESSTVLLLRRL